MEKYISIIKDDIKRFIKNYLIAGELVDVAGMSDLEEYIPSKYPYLSILYLLKQDNLYDDAKWFVDSYNLQLLEETEMLKKSLGHFLWNKNEMDKLTTQLSEMKSKVSSLSKEIEELTSQREGLKSQNLSLKGENMLLKQKVNNLISKIEKMENTPNVSNFPIDSSSEIKHIQDTIDTAIDSIKTTKGSLKTNASIPRRFKFIHRIDTEGMNRPVNYNKKYPPRENINISNVFTEIIVDCLPRGKFVFEDDKISSSGLELDKLNSILEFEYNVDTIIKNLYGMMTFKHLKYRIISLLSN